MEEEVFRQQERKFPVYFPFAFAENDRIIITLPAGTVVESFPQRQSENIGYAAYQSASQSDGRQLVMQRQLRVNGIFFRPDQYSDLKGFFGKVRAGDEQQIVLQGGNIHAQSNN
jgi:hypothetical protein